MLPPWGAADSARSIQARPLLDARLAEPHGHHRASGLLQGGRHPRRSAGEARCLRGAGPGPGRRGLGGDLARPRAASQQDRQVDPGAASRSRRQGGSSRRFPSPSCLVQPSDSGVLTARRNQGLHGGRHPYHHISQGIAPGRPVHPHSPHRLKTLCLFKFTITPHFVSSLPTTLSILITCIFAIRPMSVQALNMTIRERDNGRTENER
jgi:hypothetical protein